MRLFVAIDLDEQLKEKVLQFQKRFLGEAGGFADLKIVERKNFHFTLKFLGEVSDNSVTELAERIKSASKLTDPFNISVSGLSFFNNPSYITVVFLEVNQGKDQIIHLENALNEKLEDFRKEDYDPRPHLTFARVGIVTDRKKLLDKLKELEKIYIGEMRVEEIKLFQSSLTGIGPVYTPIKTFTLG